MIDRESHIKELYDLKHRKDNINSGADYENNILNKTLSNVLYKNPTLAGFLGELRLNVVWLIESVTILHNFWNYTVPSKFDKNNN